LVDIPICSILESYSVANTGLLLDYILGLAARIFFVSVFQKDDMLCSMLRGHSSIPLSPVSSVEAS